MKNTLKNLSEIVAKANDMFYSKFDNIDTVIGIMDKNLRNQGIKADAITIDCIALDKKIVFLIHDDKPNVISIALGNKNGDIHSSSEYALNEISETVIVDIMAVNFII
ncbi:hypothetical protein [Candidatus Colwellia aromaticivorans]|uniref:hypothetical protein n=1 Tax=Candidatus Colwellia aromaticivorans TaxID=2267621 RepID=UPI000DF24507|nr:hypothetical protein [Candidatus Colwellia aromaticivorans]